MRYRWDNYTGLPRDLYIASHAHGSNLEMRKKCHLFEAFVDLFGAFFLCLKDHFMILWHAKIHNGDGQVGEEKIDWLGIEKIYRSFQK